ncbi:carbohydrate ABC transporter permease [Candidatus Manganitrophus noduliformans]|uniref:Sugar ABC transporter permease n=1 Tax=Candidatus Manganitrophus noduliformans TaxID=2606439 RepID=A0A7X6I918_9BACT|nr:sugar ABC transporter permease [Candidatus Manganitrophus noduliformans]NKE69236.1 sugar ABC transporter permease [Candidatus Manganitrophus noduliformans]
MRSATTRLGFLLVSPAVILLAAVALVPIGAAFFLSLQRRFPIFQIVEFVGLENYRFLLIDPRFWNSLGNTLYFTLVAVALELALGLAVALLLDRAFPGRGWMRAIVLLPWAIPTVVSSRMWEWLYNVEFGLFNFILTGTGLAGGPVNWLGDPFWAIHAAILIDVWKSAPFAAILLTAGLQTIPRELYLAARVDGAGGWGIFRHIILPSLTPMILVVLLFRTLDAFRVFDAIYVLTGGGPANTTETLSIYTYKVLFQTLQFGYGSALSVAMFLCVVAISLVYLAFLGRERRFSS